VSSDQLGFVPERLMSSRRLGPAPERLSSSGESLGGTEPAPERPSSFGQLGLTPELLRAVAAQGYTQPTPVQAQAIPIVLAGRDLLASAQTGTGKTAAFVLPILQLLNASRPAVRYLPAGKGRRGATGLPIRCLVLTPTRELALQVEESVRTYGAERPVRSTIVYGGVGFDPQVRALRGGPEILVATPGRLLDHAGQGTIDLGSVEILVLDEADRMLDMGFIRDIRRILALLPARRQNLLFSATFSDEIRGLADGLLRLPAHVQIARRNSVIELVRQVVYPVDRERKRELLSHLIRGGRIDRALVFTRTKHGANRLAEQLCQDGIGAAAIHGNKSQGQRVRALDDFKAGRVAILVATEIAARGLDIESLPHVVNFELPTVAQDYIHRIGRTGRAGLEGDAVSLVCVDENALLLDIETLLRQGIRREVVPGFEVDRSIRREPIRLRSVGANRPNQGHRAPAREPGRVRFGAAPVGIGALPPGFGAARWPNVHRDPPVRVEHAPARGMSAGRPANAGYPRPMTSSRPTPSARPLPSARPVPSPRPMPYSRPGGRGVPVVSLPGERIARLGDRPA
jgi:ATP-dependent RNA helicase RhlE